MSAGLNPRAVAGGPSVTRFTHRSCTGIIHSGIPNAAVKNMDITSPTFEEIMYLQNERLKSSYSKEEKGERGREHIMLMMMNKERDMPDKSFHVSVNGTAFGNS